MARSIILALLLSAPFASAWAPRRHTIPAKRPSLILRSINENEPADGTVVKLTTLDRDAIVYDSRTGRFYEKEIEMICREEFCAIEEKTGKPIVLSLEEKERIFVEAMQAYFYDGREILSDSDFDQLKEDLLWEGSAVAALSRDENKYLAAMQAYLNGKPMMADEEFNALKKSLILEGSAIAVDKEPKCFVDTGICSVTWSQDKVRQYVAYLPTAVVISVLWAIFSFELTPLKYVNPIFGLVLGSPIIYFASIFFAENIFFQKSPLVASGPCPDCNTENRVLFGDVLGVEGFSDVADVKCSNCKVPLQIQRETLRVSSAPKAEKAE
eukprot:CAMPEP_0172582270 /NCGR_PEP_ID=MMETSP1068-20121228/1717_1 /TAXON_ID=35684 /ORGANISM="Pseudopedinella elastica, Strain CCMP716" /LENGTH=325 /DNA_ID=CAMNT_0013375575 /DNA_START=32 /DNA_END=1009 /DNA_ORIENTATION=-